MASNSSSSSSLYDYLSRGFCNDCSQILRSRIDRLELSGALEGIRLPKDTGEEIFPKIKGLLLSEEDSGERERDDLVEAAGGDDWEWRRMSKVVRKKDFKLVERHVNILQGLELHTNVFNSLEQEKIVRSVYQLQKLGQEGKLKDRTYSEPRKWMRGKGRVTMQFGCCYNYAMDKDGNPPGIIKEEEVDTLPPVFKLMIKRLVRWHILPPSCVPDSCIVNIYNKDDCIPPHIDHHDFLRPFCTISFLSECNILFGQSIKVAGPGEFDAPFAMPLPVGSVLILNGNGADVAKHCVPGVPAKRISITFRKMDPSKVPYHYDLDPKLQGLVPLTKPTMPPPQKSTNHPLFMQNQQTQQTTSSSYTTPERHVEHQNTRRQRHKQQERWDEFSKLTLNDDFPPLGGSSAGGTLDGSSSGNTWGRSSAGNTWGGSSAGNSWGGSSARSAFSGSSPGNRRRFTH